MVRWTKRYLPPRSRILEGGCGRGQNVWSLHQAGYDAYGVDFAPKTIAYIRECAPELKVHNADVRRLPFPDGYFDGYWSLGVIEHFYEGYGAILQEAARVIRKSGYFFITFPHMSRFRKYKARHGQYSTVPPVFGPEAHGFYQYCLDDLSVIEHLNTLGFRFVKMKQRGSVKGMKDEVRFCKTLLQKLHDSRSTIAITFRLLMDIALARLFGHTLMLIMKKL